MRRPEQIIQKAVFKHFEIRKAPGVVAMHIPMGGYRRPIEAAILKGMGARPGMPDVLAIKNGHAHFLEIKTEDGRLSPKQEETLRELGQAGATVAVAKGLDAALGILESWGMLKGKAA